MRKLIRLKCLESGKRDAVAQLESIGLKDTPVLIVSGNLKTEILSILHKHLSKHPRVEILVNWEGKNGKNLDFLCELNFAQVLRFQFAYDLNSLAFLSHLNKLEELYLSETKNTNVDLSVVTCLTRLKRLRVEGAKQGMASISKCPSLEQLELFGIKLNDLSFLANHPRILHLKIGLGDVGNFDALNQSNLKSINLFKLSNLKDISFVGNLTHLQCLGLERLTKIKVLPDFTALPKLRQVALNHMRGITDLSPLLHAKALTDLIMEESGHLEPESFISLKKHPRLKYGRIALVKQSADQELKKILPLKPEKNPFVYI